MTLHVNGKQHTISFAKSQVKIEDRSKSKRLDQNVHTNNFCKAVKFGYLGQYTTNFWGSMKWKMRLFVLSNVGLLIFEDPQ